MKIKYYSNNNPLAEVEHDLKKMGDLKKFLRDNPDVYELSFAGNQLTQEDCEELAKTLINNETVVSLNLSNTGIDDKKCDPITDILKANPHILKINLSYNEITNDGLCMLVYDGGDFPLHINLSHNKKIDDVTVSKLLRTNRTKVKRDDDLKFCPEFDFSNTSVSLEIIEEFNQRIDQWKKLEEFCKQLSHTVEENGGAYTWSKELDFRNKCSLSFLLKRVNNIVIVNFIGIKLSEEEYKILGKHNTLIEINLSNTGINFHNGITNKECKYLVEGLKDNKKLQKLDLSGNLGLRKEGLKYLWNALKENKSIKCLILEEIDLTTQDLKEISDLFLKNKTLQKLYMGIGSLRCNPDTFTKDGLEYMIKILSKNDFEISYLSFGNAIHENFYNEIMKIYKLVREKNKKHVYDFLLFQNSDNDLNFIYKEEEEKKLLNNLL